MQWQWDDYAAGGGEHLPQGARCQGHDHVIIITSTQQPSLNAMSLFQMHHALIEVPASRNELGY